MADTDKDKLTNILTASERLDLLDEYRSLTENQKKIILKHAECPLLSKEELASRLGIKSVYVYEVFHSKAYEIITEHLAKQGLHELVLAAMSKLRQLLIKGSDKVQMETAVTILENRDILKTTPRTVKTDNKMVVFWGNDKDKHILGRINGNPDSVLSASKAGGSPQLAGPV